jgi:hypothetical protein
MYLDQELDRCRKLVSSLREQFEELRASLSLEEERLGLLERLSKLDEPKSGDVAPEVAAPDPGVRSLENAVVAYLNHAGKALHISTIRQKLLRDGVPIPGKGVDANVITRIRRDARITRAPGQRGFYLLTRGVDPLDGPTDGK